MEVIAAVGLGSNLGNRLLNLRAALKYMDLKRVKAEHAGTFEVLQTSDVFETPPWGVTDQPHFLNACLTAKCTLPPEELLTLLKNIEARMGRQETRRWGERVIDLDILAMGPLIWNSPTLRVPHMDMRRRGFVLIPLAQILPDWVDPVTHRSVAEMTESFKKEHYKEGNYKEEYYKEENSNSKEKGFVRICRL
ncbi:MAG: 2-amino-4-hydroxy-6-hydroxymethyldihydropteridine diphosphokinase [Synergistaceae bacterium]|jgi:2-amino-4-hydroxy-6-hydroxymethyldihydropteridine diphosphokinase|nr:2-amino-4-hydroxy-6-hydroxymethyldihydropteridine diphosphokinase [Synergistaceae bacterium]